MSDVRELVDRISRENGFGDLSSAATNNLWGINHSGVQNLIPTNRDNHGITFFTRPRLNLSYDNISANRKLTPLLDGVGKSDRTYHRAIRVLLDPHGATVNGITSPLVDNKQAFIPILTNTLLSSSGWRDLVVDTYTSKSGNYKEAWAMVDGTSHIYEVWESTNSFKNIEGDPISLLFNTWLQYTSSVYDGTMVPYPDAVFENEIDYNTRIYRLILDPSKQFVQKIAACGAAFPVSSPMGAVFNFSIEDVYAKELEQISVQFKCIGADYNDPILIKEFNEVVCMFNLEMRDEIRRDVYVEVKTAELSFFNYRGYPRIDPETFALTWWVPKEEYALLNAAPDSKLTKAAPWQFPFPTAQPSVVKPETQVKQA